MIRSSINSTTGNQSAGLNLQPGATLAGGKYKIIELVGEGAMGQVFRAVHTALGRTVAIKVFLTDSGASNELGEARFLREAQAASKLQHPASVQVLDFGSEKGEFYIVMEFLDGPNLARLIAEQAPLEANRIARLMLQVLAALASAHDHGVIHRDLKPENIILLHHQNDDGVPVESLKVCDFGIAKIQATAGQETQNTITQEGTVVGTPSYMSPEQCGGTTIDPRSDIYSCGVILFEMATGALPFYADNPVVLMVKHISDPPPNPLDMDGCIDPALAQIILKCLKKNPEERYSDARELREDLKKLITDGLGRPSAMSGAGGSISPRMGMETPPEAQPVPQNASPADAPLLTAENRSSAWPSSPAGWPSSNAPDAPQADAPSWVEPSNTSSMRYRNKRRKIFILLIAVSASLLVAAVGLFLAMSGDTTTPETTIVSPPLQIENEGMGSEAQITPTDNLGALGTGNSGTGMTEKNPSSLNAPDAPSSEKDSRIGSAGTPGDVTSSTLTAINQPEGTKTKNRRRRTRPAKHKHAGTAASGKPESTSVTEAEPTEKTTPTPAKTVEKTVADLDDSREKSEAEPAATAPSNPKEIKTTTRVSEPSPKSITPEPPKEKTEKVVRTPSKPALDASVGMRDLNVRGSLPLAPVRSGIDRLSDDWVECYQKAARSAGRDARVALRVNLVIDEDGRARSPSVSGSSLSNLSRCVSKAASKIRSRTRPDTGTVQVTFKLLFIPKPPVR